MRFPTDYSFVGFDKIKKPKEEIEIVKSRILNSDKVMVALEFRIFLNMRDESWVGDYLVSIYESPNEKMAKEIVLDFKMGKTRLNKIWARMYSYLELEKDKNTFSRRLVYPTIVGYTNRQLIFLEPKEGKILLGTKEKEMIFPPCQIII
ncbi:MAG TPA: hypothetical protein VFQ59_01515 [Candidatus Paceibacterota bacterium]|nr:hypothetical protein [Candidatus Paceibacterota bacterium]